MERQKGLMWQRAPFIGSTDDYESAQTVLFGIPMDFTTSFRPGTRFGPARTREVSEGLETYSPYLDRDLNDIKFFDAGDVEVHFGNVTSSLENGKRMTEEILNDGKKPFMLGGEHLVSLPVIEAVAAKYPDLVVLHFDAHTDLRDEFWGEKLSHATVMKKAIDYLAEPSRLYQFGIRSGTAEEFAWARENLNFYPFEVLTPFMQVRDSLEGRPIYVSIDIDVVDPAYAPGTGTVEPGGCTSNDILQVVHNLRGLDVVGFDIVELAPALDHSDITALLVAKLVREALLVIS